MLTKIRIALLSLWLGAMAFFSFVVAPAAFAALPTPQLAGNLVSRTLGITEIIGIAIGATLMILLVVARERQDKNFLIELIAVTLMTLAMVVSHFIVTQRLRLMRTQAGDISALALTDPLRLTFDRLHQYSVWLMSFDILAALVLVVILVRRSNSVNVNA